MSSILPKNWGCLSFSLKLRSSSILLNKLRSSSVPCFNSSTKTGSAQVYKCLSELSVNSSRHEQIKNKNKFVRNYEFIYIKTGYCNVTGYLSRKVPIYCENVNSKWIDLSNCMRFMYKFVQKRFLAVQLVELWKCLRS